MSEGENRVFTLMVVGDEPDELVKKYDSSLEVEPYVKYYYKDVSKYRKKAIKISQDLVDNSSKLGLTPFMVDFFKDKVNSLKKLSDFEYYTTICGGCSFDKDGNALSTENPDGKWGTCRIGRNLCISFTLKNGSTALQARFKEIDWSKMHMINTELYSTAWKLFHNEIEPKTKQEKTIYDNIKNQKRYFDGFDCEEDYVNYSCSYWCYAYLDKDGWKDADDHKDYKWITEFYDKFVMKLKPDDYISLYECSKPE